MKMRKWYLLLILALLANTLHARAEGDIYFTNHEDRYYHLDENCDRPDEIPWWGDAPVAYYEREIYQKAPISEAAALEFGKMACPVCVNVFEPVYLGKHFPDWPYEALPWEISGMDPAQEQEFWNARPADYVQEVSRTSEAFSAYYEEIYDHETNTHVRRHAYPAVYAGRFSSNSLCSSYRVVNPDEEILNTFRRMFGGGAWIVPAKYGYDEIMESRDRVVQELMAWCEAHPETDARWVAAGSPDYENYAVIEINGADWQQAAAAMEATAPIYIHFKYGELIETDDF